MNFSSRDLIAWLRWADAAVTGSEKRARAAKVQAHIYPEGLGFLERSRRESIVSYVEKLFADGNPDSWEGYPDPCPPGQEAESSAEAERKERPPLPPVPEWDGLVSSSSRAYRRGSLHDGTAREVQIMRERARGSPFNADPVDDPRGKVKRAK